VPEIIKDGETGFIVETVKEIVEAMKKIGTIKREKCRRRVEEYFSSRKMADGYERVYKKVIGGRL